MTLLLLILLAVYLSGAWLFTAYWTWAGFPVSVSARVGLGWPLLLLERWMNRT